MTVVVQIVDSHKSIPDSESLWGKAIISISLSYFIYPMFLFSSPKGLVFSSTNNVWWLLFGLVHSCHLVGYCYEKMLKYIICTNRVIQLRYIVGLCNTQSIFNVLTNQKGNQVNQKINLYDWSHFKFDKVQNILGFYIDLLIITSSKFYNWMDWYNIKIS